MNGKTILLLGILAFGGVLRAEDAVVPQFQNSDVVCFIGDSITHAGQYHVITLFYYLTRFPDRKFEVYNCGCSGDYAGGALKRYDWDIQVHKPTIATIMLGMNDVGRNNYGKDKTGKDYENKHKWALEGYAKNMQALSEKLAADKCKIIYLTPSIFDQTSTIPAQNDFGVNDALGLCAQECAKLAPKFGGGLVDFYSIMNKVNQEQQKANPAFTITGHDRVHPEREGHYVMAYALLKAQKCPAIVSDMAIDVAKATVAKQDNCAITELKAENGVVTFTCQENALPFPIDNAMAKKVDALVPFTESFNREMLTVTGLPAGTYKIVIDGQEAMSASAEDLGKGINLATCQKTPQWGQALGVTDPVWKMFFLWSNKLRAIACVRAGILGRGNVKPGDTEAEMKVFMDDREKEKGKTSNGAYDTYMKYAADLPKLEKEATDLWQSAYARNQPKPHKYEIRTK